MSSSFIPFSRECNRTHARWSDISTAFLLCRMRDTGGKSLVTDIRDCRRDVPFDLLCKEPRPSVILGSLSALSRRDVPELTESRSSCSKKAIFHSTTIIQWESTVGVPFNHHQSLTDL